MRPGRPNPYVEKFEDTKAKDRQQNEKSKRTNNDLLNITQNTKGRPTRTQLKTGIEVMCLRRVGSSCENEHFFEFQFLQVVFF